MVIFAKFHGRMYRSHWSGLGTGSEKTSSSNSFATFPIASGAKTGTAYLRNKQNVADCELWFVGECALANGRLSRARLSPETVNAAQFRARRSRRVW